MRAHAFALIIASATLLLPVCAHSQAAQAPPASAPAVVQIDPLGEAIRERIDHVRYERVHDRRDHEVHGERIVLADAVGRYYESQQFRAKWRDPQRLGQLVDALLDLVNDGLDPTDYHFEALDGYRAELRRAKVLPIDEQANLELLATDALMLGLYHLYLGKVDPVKLSSQWNFGSRPVDEQRGFAALTEALESGRIHETFKRARPQHPWYQRGRERLKEYRALAAVGGWPTLPEGPTLKPGMSDTRVPTLRERLQFTRDLEAGGGEPPPPKNVRPCKVSRPRRTGCPRRMRCTTPSSRPRSSASRSGTASPRTA
jgi:murein L,D-transpeptidase YcbB/YkuD